MIDNNNDNNKQGYLTEQEQLDRDFNDDFNQKTSIQQQENGKQNDYHEEKRKFQMQFNVNKNLLQNEIVEQKDLQRQQMNIFTQQFKEVKVYRRNSPQQGIIKTNTKIENDMIRKVSQSPPKPSLNNGLYTQKYFINTDLIKFNQYKSDKLQNISTSQISPIQQRCNSFNQQNDDQIIEKLKYKQIMGKNVELKFPNKSNKIDLVLNEVNLVSNYQINTDRSNKSVIKKPDFIILSNYQSSNIKARSQSPSKQYLQKLIPQEYQKNISKYLLQKINQFDKKIQSKSPQVRTQNDEDIVHVGQIKFHKNRIQKIINGYNNLCDNWKKIDDNILKLKSKPDILDINHPFNPDIDLYKYEVEDIKEKIRYQKKLLDTQNEKYAKIWNNTKFKKFTNLDSPLL